MPIDGFDRGFRFSNATDLLIRLDHYVLRMFRRLGYSDEDLGVAGSHARHSDSVVETAGFHTLAGFVADTRAFLSIPARHDVCRRAAASHLATLVAAHQVSLEQAGDLVEALAVGLARDSYRFGGAQA